MKKYIALIMALILAFSAMSVSAYAEDTAETVVITVGNVEFTFSADTSEDFRNKFIENYFNSEDDGAEAYGLTCTLFGHNIETSSVSSVTHKVRTSSPRCLKEYFSVDTCTRCDYASKTLVSSEYIACC